MENKRQGGDRSIVLKVGRRRAEGRKRQGRKTIGTKPGVIQQSFSVLTLLEVNSPRNGGKLRPKRQSPEDGGTRWWSKEGGS